MKTYLFHPLADMFKLMTQTEYNEHRDDIKKNGLKRGITLFEGKILDGRNRYRACKELGIEFKTLDFKGTWEEARAYVISSNLHRRHMTPSDKKEVLMRLIAEQDALGMTNKEVADIAETSERTVERKRGELRAENPPKGGGLSGKNDEQVKTDPVGPVDTEGVPIPAGEPAAYWARIPEAKRILGMIRAAKSEVAKLHEEDLMWCEVSLSQVLGDLTSAVDQFKFTIPTHVCPYCKGINVSGCYPCKGKGVVSDILWKPSPEGIAKQRE